MIRIYEICSLSAEKGNDLFTEVGCSVVQLGESHNFSRDSYYIDRVKSAVNCCYIRCFVADENQSSTTVETVIQECFRITCFTVYNQKNDVKYTVRRSFKIEFCKKKTLNFVLQVLPFYELLLTHSQWLRVRVGFVFLISFRVLSSQNTYNWGKLNVACMEIWVQHLVLQLFCFISVGGFFRKKIHNIWDN